MLIVSYGAGTNSTAMLVGMKERGIVPDHIVFSDTAGERPHTYAHIDYMQGWCKTNGFPEIRTVVAHQPSKYGSLEVMCLTNKVLPSIAYGFKSCSVQYKIEPFDKWIKDTQKEHWPNIKKAIGIDAGESHRAKEIEHPWGEDIYPLLDWDWDRDDCVDAISRHGIPQPGKSSCFYCPSMKQTEIREMAQLYPDLMERALAMEANAELTTIKGLGRSFRWADVIATDDLFPESYIEIDCGCYDG